MNLINQNKELEKEKENLEDKENALNIVIKSDKQKSLDESKIIQELKFIKENLAKAQTYLKSKSIVLDALI